ncbi:MAG: response regulator [Lachnospiraceae bacterium]|nr:response regulator [Lachnospiraceae bacterium]
MKYKILITGKNDSVIDGFFTKMGDQFEVLSTSSRYEDMAGHMNYFAPDIFVYCLYKESQERINKVAGIKRRLSQSGVPFVTIGAKEDCAQFEADAPGVSDLTLCLPLTANVVREEIIKLIQKSKAAPAENISMSAAKPSTPAENINMSAAKPSAPAGNANASAAKPSVPAASDASKTTKRRELSEGLIREALTSDEAYEEMIYALERKLDLLEAGSTRRKHVLVVDDDSMMLKLMKEYLHEKYDVATALNGKIALKFLERKQTDLILLDYEMPGENGPAVLEQLRASVDTRDIPVIFLTGVTEGKKIQEALALKPQSYLLKPIQRGKLMEAIGKVIG